MRKPIVGVMFFGFAVLLSSCQLVSMPKKEVSAADHTAPLTTATPGGGTYGIPQSITLTSNEPAMIYFTLDGSEPRIGGSGTRSGTSPVSGIGTGQSSSDLRFFAVDSSGNREQVQDDKYVIDTTVPTLSLVGSPPSPIGLLETANVVWRSDKNGTFVAELGGTGAPGTGKEIASGAVSASASENLAIPGTQLSYTAATSLWIYVTDDLGHMGATSLVLALRPMVEIPVPNIGLGQIALTPNGRKAYIAQSYADSVTVIDTDPADARYNTVVKTVPVGIKPGSIAATPNGKSIYVTSDGNVLGDPITISMISTATDTVDATTSIGVGTGPNGIAVTPDSTRAYFLNFQNQISVLDTNPADASFNSVVSTISRRLLLIGRIAFTPDGNLAVVNWGGMLAHGVDVLSVNPTSPTYNTIISTPVPVVEQSSGDVAVTSDSRYAFATDTQGYICRIDLQTGSVGPIGPFAVQDAFALSPDDTTILLGGPNSTTLSVLNSADLSVRGSVPVRLRLGFFGTIAFAPDGSRAYAIRNITSVNSEVAMIPLYSDRECHSSHNDSGGER